MNKTLGLFVILFASFSSVRSSETAETSDASQPVELKTPLLLGFQCIRDRSGLGGDALKFTLSQEVDDATKQKDETFVFARVYTPSRFGNADSSPLTWAGLRCSLAEDVVACKDPKSTNTVSLERWSKKSTYVTKEPKASVSTFWRLSLFSKEFDPTDETPNPYIPPVAKPLHAINLLRVAEKMEIIPGIDYDFLDINAHAVQTCTIQTEKPGVR